MFRLHTVTNLGLGRWMRGAVTLSVGVMLLAASAVTGVARWWFWKQRRLGFWEKFFDRKRLPELRQ